MRRYLMILTGVLMFALTLPLSAQERTEPIIVGWLELNGTMPDYGPPFAWVDERAILTLRSVVDQLQIVAEDERYGGVVIALEDAKLALSQIDEIAMAIRAVRRQGKHVAVYAEQYDLPTYVLACEADTILLHRKGALYFTGLNTEEIYLADLFGKIGLEADLLQVGEFKGAADPLVRNAPSEAWNQNINALLDDLYGQIVTHIAEGRGLSAEDVEKAIAQCLTMSDEDYVARGLIDYLTDHDLADFTAATFGEAFEWDDAIGLDADAAVKIDNPFALLSMLFAEPQYSMSSQALALIQASGPIMSGESEIDSGIFGSETIGSRTIVEALHEARDDERIKGVVMRIDSPGGSALASEIIWQAVRETAAVKPVYVCVGSMAASGGYYIASGADRIFVAPGSIVGSIGVVGGKLVLGGLYEKLGIAVHRRSRGGMGDLFNSVEKFDADQRTVVMTLLERIYEQFLDRVREGRGERLDDVHAVAAGRLFTGRQAVALGMADAVGGVNEALQTMADELGMEAGSYDIVHLPPAMGLGEFLEKTFGFAGVRGPSLQVDVSALQTVRGIVGPQIWRHISRTGNGLMLLREEPVLMLMPQVIVVK